MFKKTNHNRFFIENMVKEILLEQASGAQEEFLNNPMLADPGNPDSQGGMTPQQIDDVVWEKPPPELVSDNNFRTELRKYCGDKYVEGEFDIDAGKYYQKKPGEKCQWYSYLWNAGFPNQSKWPGGIHLNQHLEEARDMYNNPKKYISQIQGAKNDEDVKNWAVENWIYRREQFFDREYKRKQAEIGSTSGKPAFSELGKSIGGFMSFFYQLFTEDAQEYVRDVDRSFKREEFDNNIQLAVISLNKTQTEGVGGTQLERVRNHSMFYSKYSNKTGTKFENQMAKKYTAGIKKFVPATWDPSFYRIHEDILEYIVNFIEDETPKLLRRLHNTTRKDDATGQRVINLGKVKSVYQSSFKFFKLGLNLTLNKIFAPARLKAPRAMDVFAYEVFKNDSYVNNLLDNISRSFFLGPGGWSGGNTINENINEQLGRPSYPSSTSIYSAGQKSQAQRDLEAKIKKNKIPYDLPVKANGDLKNGKWSPLVLFLLTLRGFDFFSENVKVQIKGKNRSKFVQKHGLTAREYARDAQVGLMFSKNRARRSESMVNFLDTWSSMTPSKFFNDYYINEKYIPSLFDKNKEDSEGHITHWIAFQRATIYDPTSEIAQNADRSWGMYGDQKIQDKQGKEIKIPKGYAYFVKWTEDTFNLFEKEQLVQKIADYNTNVTMGLIYGAAEWSLFFRAFSASFGLMEASIHQAGINAWRQGQTMIGPMLPGPGAQRALKVASFGRSLGVWSRTGIFIGFIAAGLIIFDPAGWFDIRKKFAEKYGKIEKYVCEFKDLCERVEKIDTDREVGQGIKNTLIKIYENIIIAYTELISFYTEIISTIAGQGISRRDLIIYERFKVVSRLQYFQKYEANLKNLFAKSLEDTKKLSEKEVIEVVQGLKKAGFDPVKHCETIKKQVTQLKTRSNQETEFVEVPTGTPEEWTGFPTHQDLLGNRAKNKDELQSALDSLRNNVDIDPKAIPPLMGLPYTSFYDTMRGVNRSQDPLGTLIDKGIQNINSAINWSSSEVLKDKDSEENKIKKESILLKEAVNWDGILQKLNQYYGKNFNPKAAIDALNLAIIDREKFSAELSNFEEKNKIPENAAGEFFRYINTRSIRKMEDFSFRKTTPLGKAIYDLIQNSRDLRSQISGYKTETFTNYSNFFAEDDGAGVFFTARRVRYDKNEIPLQGDQKFTYVTYSNLDKMYYEVGFREPSEIFTKFSSPIHGIAEAGQMQAPEAKNKIFYQRNNGIDLDAVGRIFNEGDKDQDVENLIQGTIKFWLFDPTSKNKDNKYNANRRITVLYQIFNTEEGLFKDFLNIQDQDGINRVINKMDSKLIEMRRIINQGVDPDDINSTVDPKQDRAYRMLFFHIKLMKFLNSSVKITWIRDAKQTKKMRKNLLKNAYSTLTGSKQLKTDIKNKMFLFLQMGNISNSFDRHFSDDTALNFKEIRLSEGII